MREVPPIAYVLAVSYVVTFIYLVFVWNKDDRKKH